MRVSLSQGGQSRSRTGGSLRPVAQGEGVRRLWCVQRSATAGGIGCGCLVPGAGLSTSLLPSHSTPDWSSCRSKLICSSEKR